MNPFIPVRVIVEVPVSPGDFWDGLTGPAEMVKSVILNVTTVVCGPAEVLVPVTVTL